ncbi:hypothetical protein BP5796_01441 [Coleophoma crateriformis]|uniref:Uncharacterized protein n=1 Tax=Coleophoma crateriformis TaxID=565419 RepID=A0A3D8T0E3_9HELO|nr:hypothetical protein BP5796_01441 [Coleophoma crateriformis]
MPSILRSSGASPKSSTRIRRCSSTAAVSLAAKPRRTGPMTIVLRVSLMNAPKLYGWLRRRKGGLPHAGG